MKPGRKPRQDGRKPQTVASEKYNSVAYDRINLSIKKGNKELIKERAACLGYSVNGYINNLMYKDIPNYKPMDGNGGGDLDIKPPELDLTENKPKTTL